jgi:transposase
MSEQPSLSPPGSGISAADWEATPASVRALVLTLLPLRDLVQTLGEQVADLQARVNQHSANSSRPPSSDPPSAPPRPRQPPSPRRQGAQPGHSGRHRPLLPPEQVDELIVHLPTDCPYCQTTLPIDLPLNENKAVLRQQVWDMPPIRPHVTEHQFPTVTCPHCQHDLRAPQPQGVQALPPGGGAFGAQVTSVVGLLHGRYRLSTRETAALLADLFGLEVSLGSIPALCQSVSEAVAPVYQQVQRQVEVAPALNVDETGWKEAGAKRWLWVAVARGAAATVCTLFAVTQHRSAACLRRLLGGESSRFGGVVGSDRFKAYLSVPVTRRQLCWAHLKRNLTAFHERDGPVGEWGGAMLEQVGQLFAAWHAVCEGELDHSGLLDSIAPVQKAMWELLTQGQSLPVAGVRAFSQELLKLWPALWMFVDMEGVEPTNNVAERALRPAVLWRKGCFGAQSTTGNEFVERILTVTTTCQQQERHVLTFLTQAVQAHWSQLPAPNIILG